MSVVIGSAGWSIGKEAAGAFPAEGSSLERYAAVFAGTEINSSFHRPHRRTTWERWAASVPNGFRFSVKLPKTITHGQKLRGCEALLEAHLADAGTLGAKLAVHLVQLPPSLAFDAEVAGGFFEMLRGRTGAAIACEPRHASWFEPEAEALLTDLQVVRVAADPARVPAAAAPGGWRGLSYWRLHGSPVIYRSSYGPERLAAYAAQLRSTEEVWCIFDNTASSAATRDALTLMSLL
jgi:uncharacterized protein YecE (DUF72 family)